MAKNVKVNKTSSPAKAEGSVKKTAEQEIAEEFFFLKQPLIWLVLVTIVVYFPVLKYGLTELDDSIFIKEFGAYNENLGNLVTSFQRGLFDAVKDPYYRPLFMDCMILNYWISGHGENIYIYHLVNLLFHICNVILLYKLFLNLDLNKIHAFVLTLVFAVHPVLTQAVAWIPGRNDTLLAIFTLLFLNFSIDFSKSGKLPQLLLANLFLLIAFFTKETAVFAAPVCFVIILLWLRLKIRDYKFFIQIPFWIVCLIIWYYVRSKATVQLNMTIANVFSDFVHHLPLILQYIGKIILPFNLSVFPTQEDTTIYFGITATILLILILVFSKNRNTLQIISAFLIFFLFLIPALIVPGYLNEQTFEHRLYLPIIGILLLCPSSVVFSKKFSDGQIMIYSFVTLGLLSITNYMHQPNFADPLTFWRKAEATSPHSAFAAMHRSEYEDNLDTKCTLIRKAYSLNPKEKYINFYYAEMLIKANKRDSILSAEPYLLAEKNISGFHKCNFYLARISVEKNDIEKAIAYLTEFLKIEPETSMEGAEANNNLLVLYINSNQTNKIIYQAKHMKQIGLNVPREVLMQYHL